MNASLLLGIVIGMGAVLFCFGVFLALPARRMSKSGTTFNDRSLAELTERNAIGHDQRAALWIIAGYLAPKDTREADRKARRERIATAVLPAVIHGSGLPIFDDNGKNHGMCIESIQGAIIDGPGPPLSENPHARAGSTFAWVSVAIADALIAELDKDEP